MIVVAGEALIDLLPTADRDGQPALRPAVGGSPLNIALGLGRLGRKTAFLGAISNDAFGEQIVAALRDSGVDTALVTRVERPTLLAVASLTDGEARYSFYDTGTASRGMTLRELAPHPEGATWLHFGSIALAAEPAASTLIARAKPHHETRRRRASSVAIRTCAQDSRPTKPSIGATSIRRWRSPTW